MLDSETSGKQADILIKKIATTNDSQAQIDKIQPTTNTSSALGGYLQNKTQRCSTAAASGNPRNNVRAMQGSKQVINHIQTIIRNNGNPSNNDESLEDINSKSNAVKNNNFFTTDVRE